MDTRFAISEYNDAVAVNKELDELIKKPGISLLPCQKTAMVFVAFSGIAIYTETFTAGVIVVVLRRTSP